MFVNFEYQSKLTWLDGRPMVFQIEAQIKNSDIKVWTAWCDETAKYIDPKKLSHDEFNSIIDHIFYHYDMRQEELQKELSQGPLDEGPSDQRAIVNELNARGGK
jgi:hypothetical protein